MAGVEVLARRAARRSLSHFTGSLSAIFVEDGVAARVAPEDEVVRGDVGVGDVLVVLDAGLAAELAPPVVDGVLHLGGHPLAGLSLIARSRSAGPSGSCP